MLLSKASNNVQLPQQLANGLSQFISKNTRFDGFKLSNAELLMLFFWSRNVILCYLGSFWQNQTSDEVTLGFGTM